MLEQTTTQLMTLDEFIAEYHKQPFELVNGEKRLIMPGIAKHGLMIRALFLLLYNHCVAHQLGEVFQENPFVETYNSNWVKGSKTPDVLFFSAEKWKQYIEHEEKWQDKPFVLIPDLVIEVVSPNDVYTEIDEKVEEYLANGVNLIWIVDPQRQRVTVYHDDQYQRLTAADILTGGDVLPGLKIVLGELFN
jgi:Uma2 family endonuclease